MYNINNNKIIIITSQETLITSEENNPWLSWKHKADGTYLVFIGECSEQM